MMKIEGGTPTNQLTGAALDWAVAVSLGYEYSFDSNVMYFSHPIKGLAYCYEYAGQYSTDWGEGGALLDTLLRNGMSLHFYPDDRQFQAVQRPVGRHDLVTCACYGDTSLIAAMRCFVMCHLGTHVNVPRIPHDD